MAAMRHFGICFKRCERFIKASHVGNDFLSALIPFLNLHLDRKDGSKQAFHNTQPLSKEAVMQHAVLCGHIARCKSEYQNAN